jgi:FixJ family two-component response regulator
MAFRADRGSFNNLSKNERNGTMKSVTSASSQTAENKTLEATAPDGRTEGPPDHRITVVDDDSIICDIMEAMIASWNFIPYILPEPYLLDELIENGASTDIFLLDMRLPNGSTIDWIPRILNVFPEAKVIVMTGYADTETVIEAIRSGAFDFLQKPIAMELMRHSLDRAIQMQERERREKLMVADLQQKHSQLLEQKQRLEFLNERLLDTNRAFSTLAQNLDFERVDILNRISHKIESGLIPAVDRLRSDHHLARYAIELDIIIDMLREITSGTNDTVSSVLTTTESRVASLIKKGMTTEKIADHLFISVDTVKTHRKNIRKKLNITNSQSGLRDFLLTKPESPSIW